MMNCIYSPILCVSTSLELNNISLEGEEKEDAECKILTSSEFREYSYNYLKNQGMEFENVPKFDDVLSNVLHLHTLIYSGLFEEAKNFCLLFTNEELKEILNDTPYDMYYGNILHTILYYSEGIETIEIYKYFKSLGAKPCENYYGELPWEQNAPLWVTIPGCKYKRNPDEFVNTYAYIKTFENNNSTQNYSFIVPCHCLYHLNNSDETGYDTDGSSGVYSDEYVFDRYDSKNFYNPNNFL
jgi:hypothetical protein